MIVSTNRSSAVEMSHLRKSGNRYVCLHVLCMCPHCLRKAIYQLERQAEDMSLKDRPVNQVKCLVRRIPCLSRVLMFQERRGRHSKGEVDV